MNSINYLSKLEHKKYKRFTQTVTETLEEVNNLLYKDENGKAKEKINEMIAGFKVHWSDYNDLSDTTKNIYEQLAKEILAEIGLKNNI